jgi:hypothetical protein
MENNVNNLITDAECEQFFNGLTLSLCNMYQTFSNAKGNLISNLVLVRDHDSWRKEVEPFKPYYVKDNRLIGYKEQREETKEKSPINYDNFYKVWSEWYDHIKQYFPNLDIKGLEGDDLLLLLSRKLSAEGIYNTIFCTDGDLKQLVSDKTILFRNIRSKDTPNGEFVLSSLLYNIIFNKTDKMALLQTGDSLYWSKLFGVTLGNIDGTVRQHRELGKGINIAEPAKISLTKIIGGDKKDNIFSIFGWKSSTGTREFKVSELQIEKALNECGWEYTNADCKGVFDKYENLQIFVNELRKVIHQEHVNLRENKILDHIKHNMKMIILSPNFLPQDLVAEFDKQYDELKDRILEGKDYTNYVNQVLTANSNTSATTQIYGQSIKGI